MDMAVTLFWVLFFLTFPILVLYACSRYDLLDAIGAVVICYAAVFFSGISAYSLRTSSPSRIT
jgi:hypothetical protein